MKKFCILYLFIAAVFSTGFAAQHPGLFLTPAGVKEIKKSQGKYPAFDMSVNEVRKIADNALISEIMVPVPKDGGGGYTHEKHKNNYYEMNACGIMYQLSGKKEYASFVHKMLLKYAELYPTLGQHPAVRSETPGRLFWQALNEAVWLVHTANAYDCVYNFISESDRKLIEKNLFYPIAEFISNGNPENYAVFNKMHNHGTWATASVGMIGYVMGDKNLVDMALYGSNKDGKTGFIRQLDVLFSPDGYFTEGPYYQRYAIWPFMTFAQVIQNQQPELNLFSYRNGILNKAVHTLVQSTYNDEIVYLNDALYKTIKTQEMIYAANIAYKNNPSDFMLLDIARRQDAFFVSDAGLATAKALQNKKAKSFEYKSMVISDGKNGNEGGIAFLRNNNSLLTFKATSHGLSHGHYDKLSLSYFDNGNQIIPDYGAARFLNIEPKSGGNYTKENYTWAMQSIAHNTVTIDEKSHFDAKIKVSSNYHSDIQYSDISNSKAQLISGVDTNAYKGVKLQRTTALIESKSFEFPIIVDIFKVKSDKPAVIDYPFYYRGQLVTTNYESRKNVSEIKPLGTHNGYQHVWLEAEGKTTKPVTCFTWVNGNRFYSINTLTNADSELKFLRSGANDPNNNLRSETAFMLRQPNTANHTFVSVIEPHGLYDLTKEVTIGFRSSVSNLVMLADTESYTAVQVTHVNGISFLLITMNNQFNKDSVRSIVLSGKSITFTGNYYYSEIK